MIGCLPTQVLAFLAVLVYATHATQAIAFEWKPGFTRLSRNVAVNLNCAWDILTTPLSQQYFLCIQDQLHVRDRQTEHGFHSGDRMSASCTVAVAARGLALCFKNNYTLLIFAITLLVMSRC